MKLSRGFSLIELLVSIAITAVLATLLFLGTKSYLNSAKRAAEINAGKTLISAFQTYAADNGGQIIKAMDPKPGKILDKEGRPVMSHAAKRWPWRLAPYFDYNIDNVLLVNNKEAAPADNAMYSYLVTVFTTLGINGTFVGGKFGTGMAPDHPRNKRGAFCVTTIAQPYAPSKLIVFASGKMQNAPHPGCFDIGPEGVGAVGEVDYKYSDKAVVVYFDGHVELNTKDDLKDMRRWSNPAAIENNSSWSF